MKKISYILSIAIVLFVLPFHSAEAATPQTKRVCHDVMVKGKKVQQCKNVKVHHSLGGELPEKSSAQYETRSAATFGDARFIIIQ